MNVPVIEYSLLKTFKRYPEIVQKMGLALSGSGFFILDNHGLDRKLINELYLSAERFFDLSFEKKMNYYGQGSMARPRGYYYFSPESPGSKFIPVFKDAWHMGHIHDDENVYWPTEIPTLKSILTDFFHQVDAIGKKILEACSSYFNLEEPCFKEMIEGGFSLLRILNYPSIPADLSPRFVRMDTHEDLSLITLITEPTKDGIEIKTDKGEWERVQVKENQILVNSGELFEILTNGIFKSTPHRVLNISGRERRLSTPFFFLPKEGVRLKPVPECILKSGQASQFPEELVENYLKKRIPELPRY